MENVKPVMQHSDDQREIRTENVMPVRQHSDSHLSVSPSSDSSLELSTHPKESLGDVYAKPEQDVVVSPTPAASSPPDISSQTPQWSMMSSSPRAETGHPLHPDAFQNIEPIMKSPASNSMDHPPGYDPNRIPKSIFSSKPANAEWSTASNESLFSIQMGVNSFSTDYSYMLPKSGEISEEWKNSSANPYYASEVKSIESKSVSSPLPPLIEVTRDKDEKSARAIDGPDIQEKKVENLKKVLEEKTVTNIKQKTSTNVIEEPTATTSNRPDDRVVPPIEETRISSPARASSPCYSEASGNSSKSFVFPVLVNDGGKSNSLKSASEKVEKSQSRPQPQPQPQTRPQPEFQPEKQPQQKQSESQPKVSKKSWCSCFTCRPRCC